MTPPNNMVHIHDADHGSHTYFQHPSCLETLLEVSLDNPLEEAHSEEFSAQAQACDAATSGSHIHPVSVTQRKQLCKDYVVSLYGFFSSSNCNKKKITFAATQIERHCQSKI